MIIIYDIDNAFLFACVMDDSLYDNAKVFKSEKFYLLKYKIDYNKSKNHFLFSLIIIKTNFH